VIRADGSKQRWLTRDSASDDFPTWSPNGLHVAFSNDLTFTREWRSGDEIFVIGVDGSGRRRLTRNKAHDILPSWSPAP
jgi:Tol biopolymer transport system component